MGNLAVFKLPQVPAGIEETKAQDIKAQFQPMLDKMVELELRYNEVIAMDIKDPETAKLANDLLKEYIKVRTGTEKIHKAQKAFYLAGGKYVDSFKNVQLFAAQNIEPELKKIVEYETKQLEAKQEELRSARWESLKAYVKDEPAGLGVMAESVYKALLKGAKVQHETDLAETQKQADLAEKQKLAAGRKATLDLYAKVMPELDDVDTSDFTDDEWNDFIQTVETSYTETIADLQKKAVRTEIAEEKVEQIQKEFPQAASSNYSAGSTTTNVTVKDALHVWMNKSKLYQPEPPSSLQFSKEDREFIKTIMDKFDAFKAWGTKQINEKYKD